MSTGRGAVTAEERFRLNAALPLAAEKRGGSSSSGRARRSLHLKIIGGFVSELRNREAAGPLQEGDRSNLQTAIAYVEWLEHNTTKLNSRRPGVRGPTVFLGVKTMRDIHACFCFQALSANASSKACISRSLPDLGATPRLSWSTMSLESFNDHLKDVFNLVVDT